MPVYSQYLYNKFLFNPANAGSDGFTSYNLTVRKQWMGYAGAPETFSLSGQTRLLKKKYKLKQNIFDQLVYVARTEGKVGLGGYIFSDRNGLTHRTGFQASYSYHAWVKDYTQLSMGLAFTGCHYRIDANESSFKETGDPMLSDKLRKGIFIPDIDFGIFLLNPGYEAGFSILQLTGAAAKTGNKQYKNYHSARHFYFFASGTILENEQIIMQPALLFKMSDQMKPQADFSLACMFKRKILTGLTYRTGGAIIANLGLKHVRNPIEKTSVYFGYSFDFSLNKIQRVTFGSHEIVIALKLGDSARRYRWLDRY